MSILVLTSDTLIGTPATGNLEYNGQFFGTDSNASRAQMQRITQGTAVNSTSGTSIDFTGIPSWVKKITVMFNGVSTTSTSPYQIQLGAGSVDTASYITSCTSIQSSSASSQSGTTGFFITTSANHGAAATINGSIVFSLLGSNAWVGSGSFSREAGANTMFFAAGSKTLSGTLDRVRITTVNGTDTFDAGSINLLWEG